MPADSNGAPGPRRVTIVEVARHAGVSHQTVSRYLRFSGGLKPATVEKIEAAIQELDYRPDLIARSMRTRRSNRMAIIIPELSYFVPADLRGAMSAASEAGYLVDVVSLEGSQERRRQRVLDLIQSERVEGILSLTPLASLGWDSERPSRGIPVLVAGEYDDKMHATGALATGQLAADIVEYLAALGHRRLLHVSGADDWASARNRRDVYVATGERLGLESYAVVEGDWSVRSGYEAARDLPADAGVTAIFGANDFVAFGVVRGLQDRGLRVPDDVSVVGWDDEEFAHFMSPPLTTVMSNKNLQGRHSMQILIARVRGSAEPSFAAARPGRLVIRGSTGPTLRGS